MIFFQFKADEGGIPAAVFQLRITKKWGKSAFYSAMFSCSEAPNASVFFVAEESKDTI